MRSLVRFSLVAVGCLAVMLLGIAQLAPRLEEKAQAQNTAGAVLQISAFRHNGPGGTGDEWVEIHNPSGLAITASSLSVDPGGPANGIGVFVSRGNQTADNTIDLACNITGTIPARGYVLCANTGGYSMTTLGVNGGDSRLGDYPIIMPGTAPTTDIPNDAGMAILPIGTNIAVNTPAGFEAAGVGPLVALDKVGFVAYGPGAPGGNAYPSLAGNFCEGTCLQPVGDASTLPTCTAPPGFSASGAVSACFGQSGQYKIERRQTVFAANGTVPRDTNVNSEDFALITPNPGINVGLNATGIAGVRGLLGAAGPHNFLSPPDRGSAQITRTALDPTASLTGPRNFERVYSQDPVILNAANNPLGTADFRFNYTNNMASSVTHIRFRLDDVSGLCGPQDANVGGNGGPGGTVGTGEARNLSATPNCTGADAGFTAILKAVNSKQVKIVVGVTLRTVLGTVIEDLNVAGTATAPPALSPLGGGIDNSMFLNPSEADASRGPDGVSGGSGVYATTFATAGATKSRDVNFKFGVVKSGRFKFLYTPEAASATAP